MSNIGENMGLFIRISFLSFAELIELFIESIIIFFNMRRITPVISFEPPRSYNSCIRLTVSVMSGSISKNSF
jgi:hypothetical protein